MRKLIEVIEKDYDLLSKEELLVIAKKILKEQEDIKEDRWRIWEAIFKIEELKDDYGDLELGDELHKIIFNTDCKDKC